MKSLSTLFFIVCLMSCDSEIEENAGKLPNSTGLEVNCQDFGEGWSIPRNQVVAGASKDAIPSIDNPQFIQTQNVNYLLDDELMVGVLTDEGLRAFPHRILEKHEIVNDSVNDVHYSMTFCPLTGTAVTWHREAGNSFGVSGLLHNSNLITYDRQTDSNWSQIYSRGVNGAGICNTLEFLPAIEISWKAWQELFPDSQVLSLETGINFSYTQPARSYNQPENVTPLFPVYNVDDRLPNYERVLLVVIGGKAKAYRFSLFESKTRLVEDFHAGKVITIVGNKELNFIVPFINTLDGARYFTLTDNLLEDIDGNVFNLFGVAMEGPAKGARLEIPYSMMGYWFAVSAFYPDVEIFLDGEL